MVAAPTWKGASMSTNQYTGSETWLLLLPLTGGATEPVYTEGQWNLWGRCGVAQAADG